MSIIFYEQVKLTSRANVTFMQFSHSINFANTVQNIEIYAERPQSLYPLLLLVLTMKIIGLITELRGMSTMVINTTKRMGYWGLNTDMR